MEKMEYRICDLRSDTFSQPTPEMKVAMMSAELGDDVYGEDPTVLKLEEKCSELFQKEAALFTPSGTMSNLLATMVHCDKRGSEMIVGHMSHFFKYEQGCYSSIAGVSMDKVKNLDDGTLCLKEVKESIRGSDIHEPLTQLVVIENTHNMLGGKVLPLVFLDEISKICKENGLKLHMDGSRIFNAAVFSSQPVSRIVRDVDSVSFCLSKSLCCPIGSILLGTQKFIEQARRFRKGLGGGMRQVGILAAAGLYALEKILPNIEMDHKHARQLSESISSLNSSIFKVDSDLQTNILTIYVNDSTNVITTQTLYDRLLNVTDSELKAGITDLNGKGIIVKSCCWDLHKMKFVFYNQITDELTNLTFMKIIFVINELEEKF